MKATEIARGVFILAVVFIGFDMLLSLLSTCDEISHYPSYKQATEKYCTAFGGPFIGDVHTVLAWVGHILHDFDKEIVALFTVILTVSTSALWWSTRKLWIASEREFLSSHRPQLRLKHIWFSTPDGKKSLGPPQPNIPINITLDIVNIGNSIARVRRINLALAVIPFGERLPQRPPYNEPGARHLDLNDIDLGIGITLSPLIHLGMAFSKQQLDELRLGKDRMYFIGTVEYWWGADKRNLRQTAFCRFLALEYPPRTDDAGRFEIDKDPDYEYQD
jgi:hypothetical protein